MPASDKLRYDHGWPFRLCIDLCQMSSNGAEMTAIGLDQEAWERWVAYRQAIRKPIKPASLEAMQVKLARFGDQQGDVVDQSISQQWQGLFPLKDKPLPGEPTKKTRAQKDATTADMVRIRDRSAQLWAQMKRDNPLGALLEQEALLARYQGLPDTAATADLIESVRLTVPGLVRALPARVVLSEPRIWSMLLYLFPGRAIPALEARAAKESREEKHND